MSSYTDPGQHIFWIASRSLGVVALVLVAFSVGLGLVMATRSVKGAGPRARVKQLHEATALAGLILIAGHGLALLGDTYLHPGLAGIAIPFVMSYKRSGPALESRAAIWRRSSVLPTTSAAGSVPTSGGGCTAGRSACTSSA